MKLTSGAATAVMIRDRCPAGSVDEVDGGVVGAGVVGVGVDGVDAGGCQARVAAEDCLVDAGDELDVDGDNEQSALAALMLAAQGVLD